MHVSCSKCGIQDILEFSKNPDEVFLEFLARFDKGLVTQKELTEELADEGIIRTEKEMNEMIGKSNPEKFLEEILRSKKDFISDYKILKNSEPKMGCKVEDLGLEENISMFLNESLAKINLQNEKEYTKVFELNVITFFFVFLIILKISFSLLFIKKISTRLYIILILCF